MKKLIAAMIAAGASNSVAAVFVMDGPDKLFAIVGAIVATVTLTLAVVAWIDKRIEHKIRNYAGVANFQLRLVLQELSNLRELEGHPPLDVTTLMKVSGVNYGQE
jgi:hypothetical protein